MGNSLREVKLRIDSTKSTSQITKAMYMVSQSKVKRSERIYKEYKDFMQRISDMVVSIVSKAETDYEHPLIKKRPIGKVCYLLVTSDRGLAGAYNTNLFKQLENEIKNNHKSKDEFVCAAIGKKGHSFINKRGYNKVRDEAIFVRDDILFVDIVPLADGIIDLYLDEKIDKLVVIHNHFVNSLTQEVVSKTLLPLGEIEGGNIIDTDYIYESGIQNTLDQILPMYIQDTIYGVILDAKTAEHSSRMNSMRSATDNAEEVIDKLQLLYNRARQEVITNELIDIVGGANALGGKD
ncbi:MAG: ATP synthase F1 subunit gamma [Anaeroplasmataceae bacterium]